MTTCIWCDLDGRAGCPVHYRRDPLLIGVAAFTVALATALVVLLVFGAVR